MAIFGPKLQILKLRSATCESCSRPPPLSSLLKLCVIVLHTQRYHPPKFHPNLKHHDGVLIFSHFARASCCLLACLLLNLVGPNPTREARCRSPPSSFSLKLCVIVLHTHRYHAPKFQPNPKHHDGVLIFSHFARAAACLLACCLLAACCLLLAAAKPGRSTLDTKKGYKTKTGSTSSVTLTLIKTEYWDRAGGGGNIGYDW